MLVYNNYETVILDKDLEVYKILEVKKHKRSASELRSTNEWFIYEVGTKYVTKIKTQKTGQIANRSENSFIINYLKDKIDSLSVKDLLKGKYADKVLFTCGGFHSYINIPTKNNSREVVYKCIIPKGSEIVYNINNEVIASSEIIIKEKLCKQ